ncbi:MAG: hypothetical protein ABJC13_02210 [Acidobacteriota bacterium]
MEKLYYSERQGRRPETPKLSFDELKRAAKVYLVGIQVEGYFQEGLGHFCVDSGFSPGLIGGDPEIEIRLTLGKSHLWPIAETLDDWSEDDFFDMVEFLCAHVSKPIDRYYHQWDGCGWHCTAFDAEEGRTEFRAKLNRFLGFYDSGFELNRAGEILAIPPTGLERLVAEPLVHHDPDNVTGRIKTALHKFRHHRAAIDERRGAVRDLADVLEFLRPELKRVLASQDEKDLFNIANSFGIRHHRSDQRTDYDQEVWLDWIFYYYLATIHTAIRLIEKHPT